MRFQQKVFLSIFATSTITLMALATSMEELLRNMEERQYLFHYDSMAQVIGDTLRQMEAATARISEASAQNLYSLTKQKGLPSEGDLRKMKASLNVSQLVLTDHNGVLVRDTETAPELRKDTLFDFCAGYRALLSDPGRMETTPILPSYPTGQAYIFSMKANATRSGIVEAGMHVSFIVDTLGKALSSDHNIRSIGLYTPNGIPLGFISQDSQPSPVAGLLPSDLAIGVHPLAGKGLSIVTRVPALVASCCECAQKHLTRDDGVYYYLLRTEVTLEPLYASVRSMRREAFALLAIALLVALFLSRWVAGVLVRRLRLFVEGVRRIVDAGDLSTRLSFSGGDEISALARTFDELTAKLDRTQKSAIEAEKSRALTEVAKQVAHDIRSPLAALKAATYLAGGQADVDRKLIRTAAGRIQEITEQLLARYQESSGPLDMPENLLLLMEGAIEEKRAELGPGAQISLALSAAEEAHGLFTTIPSSLLKRVISNLLNNAIQAIESQGLVTIHLNKQGEFAHITVEDDGKGIPSDLLPRLMQPGATFGKSTGSGLGLAHARETIQSGGGKISLVSEVGKGTRVEIDLPLTAAPSWYSGEIVYAKGSMVMIVDDDQSIHRTWQARLGANVRLVHCFGTEELARQMEGITLFLVDHEIKGSPETGLEAIARLGIASRSILVTSHAGDPAILEECRRLGLRLLPKSQVARVPLRMPD